MKRLLAALAFASLAALCNAQAFASVNYAGDDVSINLWGNAASGQLEGPFQVAIYEDAEKTPGHVGSNMTPLVGPFLTFCVETHEYFSSSGSRFDILGTSTSTVTTGRQLTGYAAWVYQSKFLALGISPDTNPSTTISGLNGVSFADAMNAYQFAVWSGIVDARTDDTQLGSIDHSEYGSLYGSSYNLHKYTDSLNTTLSTLGRLGISIDNFNSSDWGGLRVTGNVQVINIDAGYSSGYRWGQDQLIQIMGLSNDTTVVPEPATIIIWSLLGAGSWLGTRVWRRRGSDLAEDLAPGARQPWSPENRQAIHDIIARRASR